MTLNVEREVTAMRQLTVDGLRRKYAEVFGEQPRTRHKEYLIRRIAWRMQANAEGGLSQRALARAQELANDADLRVTAPRPQRKPKKPASQRRRKIDARVPAVGTQITRKYKGRLLTVTVRAGGFEYAGTTYPSLSAVAKAVTGNHWNGFHFFGLRNGGEQ